MSRAHRAFHRLIWPTLGLALALGIVLALYFREPPPPENGSLNGHGFGIATLQ
jgi:hypothetical protein